MTQQQPKYAFYVEQMQTVGGLFGSSSSPSTPTQTPQPAPPPNPNPTVQTGDNKLAADNAAAQAQQKAASTVLTSSNAVTQSNQDAAKKTILGG